MVTPEHDPRFWTGFLSSAIAESLKEDERDARWRLNKVLDRFLASPAPTEELKSTLEEMRRK